MPHINSLVAYYAPYASDPARQAQLYADTAAINGVALYVGEDARTEAQTLADRIETVRASYVLACRALSETFIDLNRFRARFRREPGHDFSISRANLRRRLSLNTRNRAAFARDLRAMESQLAALNSSPLSIAA